MSVLYRFSNYMYTHEIIHKNHTYFLHFSPPCWSTFVGLSMKIVVNFCRLTDVCVENFTRFRSFNQLNNLFYHRYIFYFKSTYTCDSNLQSELR